MQIGLNSDFRDFYDHWFDLPPHDYVLQRVARPEKGISKRNQFELLEHAGFTVPLHGLVKDVWNKTSNDYLVVYEDEFAHCGEGKVLCDRTKAVWLIGKNKYCSVFISTTDEPVLRSESKRLLAIGNRMWWLSYRSNGWMSNHAKEVTVVVISETLSRHSYALEGEHDFEFLNRFPLFAIDFIESRTRKQLMAIDFNSAPGLKGTGIEDFLSPAEIVRSITEFVIKQRLLNLAHHA